MSRDSILGTVRASLKGDADLDARREAVRARLSGHQRNLIPARGQLGDAERVALFAGQAEKVGATVARVADAGAVPEAVADYLRGRNLPQRIRKGMDKRLGALPFDKTPTLEVNTGPSDGTDLVGLSHAFGGVAETGTLVLASGGDNPTTLNFLPETHIVVISAEDIAGDYETVFERVRAAYGEGTMPRCLNLVTGPSRSGDIEQTILLGAHGPKDVHIVVVG
ncbi:LutC/YkgG family protein [Rhodobium gokarnense]|uniref:L-lactate dehydrogenase complex protein LldG n=1 Tax=Rhodobium gokarnense TaxID=364296 RepID=A0ABT3HCJ5_9HYPH|nr:lactate utilization protein [Rhodobium gokarnense]MCW2308115.1 L-lactate dehydrogenase complex protein LldG [Rhodobium gokarnense]